MNCINIFKKSLKMWHKKFRQSKEMGLIAECYFFLEPSKSYLYIKHGGKLENVRVKQLSFSHYHAIILHYR